MDAFQNLLSSSGCWRPSFNVIGSEDTKLEEAFTEEEIWSAISGLNGDKAPYLDGFPLGFWSFCRDFVNDEVLGFFKEFHK